MSTHTPYNCNPDNIGRLLVKCADKPGIVSALSTFLFQQNANIMESAQHSSDIESGMFYIRFEFYRENLLKERLNMENAFLPLAEKFSMDFKFTYKADKKRSAIFVSKEIHCLLELLW